MGVSEAFKVARGGFTSLAGEVDHVARSGVAALRRQLDSLSAQVGSAEGGLAGLTASLTPATLTLNDDQAAYIQFTADAVRGVAVFGGNAAAAGSGVIAFRVQTFAFVTAIATAGATVTVGTGTLAGTTGTDTHLTIRADTATNRLYIENRTGAARDYGFAFVGVRNGALDGTWVTL